MYMLHVNIHVADYYTLNLFLQMLLLQGYRSVAESVISTYLPLVLLNLRKRTKLHLQLHQVKEYLKH